MIIDNTNLNSEIKNIQLPKTIYSNTESNSFLNLAKILPNDYYRSLLAQVLQFQNTMAENSDKNEKIEKPKTSFQKLEVLKPEVILTTLLPTTTTTTSTLTTNPILNPITSNIELSTIPVSNNAKLISASRIVKIGKFFIPLLLLLLRKKCDKIFLF